VVKEIGCELSESGLSGQNSSAEGGLAKGTSVIPRIVRGKLFFVNGFKNSNGLLVLPAKNIRARGALIG